MLLNQISKFVETKIVVSVPIWIIGYFKNHYTKDISVFDYATAYMICNNQCIDNQGYRINNHNYSLYFVIYYHSETNFRPGKQDIFSGPAILECDKFQISDSATGPVQITLYHEGIYVVVAVCF